MQGLARARGGRVKLGQHQDDASVGGELNITPLIDIVFILLIFFVVTTTFVHDLGLPIDRPEASTGESQPLTLVRVAVSERGEITVDALPTSPWRVEAEVRDRLHDDPDAAVLVHPESPASVIELADCVGSTSQLIKATQELPHRQFIVATDQGIFYKMQQQSPDKELIIAPTAGEGATCRSCANCPWMAMNALQTLAQTLEHPERNEIQVDPALGQKALIPLQRMLDFTSKK